MFTGIIEEQGIIVSLIRGPQAARLSVAVSAHFSGTKIGESIAVNGVCLTVANIRRNFLDFDVTPETLKRSTLLELKVGDKVNLERAALISGRVGGHLVNGHIDGVGEIRKKIRLEKGFEFHFSIPSELLRYLVPKGSIAIDGISLTVADLHDALLVLYVIPHAAGTTTLGAKGVGDRVNVEVDIMSKYVERHLQSQFAGQPGISNDTLAKIGILPMGWIDN
jgi:riboflavin synthase